MVGLQTLPSICWLPLMGHRGEILSILRVERTNGEVLYEYQPAEAQRVIDERVAYLISNILDDDQARRLAEGELLGLPTETDADVEAIVDLTSEVREAMLRHGRIEQGLAVVLQRGKRPDLVARHHFTRRHG